MLSWNGYQAFDYELVKCLWSLKQRTLRNISRILKKNSEFWVLS